MNTGFVDWMFLKSQKAVQNRDIWSAIKVMCFFLLFFFFATYKVHLNYQSYVKGL